MRFKKVVLIGVMLMFAVYIAACGGGSSSSSGQPETVTVHNGNSIGVNNVARSKSSFHASHATRSNVPSAGKSNNVKVCGNFEFRDNEHQINKICFTNGKPKHEAKNTSSTSADFKISNGPYKPFVKLMCSEPRCGSNPPLYYEGIYRVIEDKFPPNTEVVVAVTDPEGNPYPFKKYTHPGTLYGIKGNVERTDHNGLLSEFEWSAFNGEGIKVDPPGLYKMTFYLKIYGKLVHVVNKEAVMERLP